jgi:hypothetical protein
MSNVLRSPKPFMRPLPTDSVGLPDLRPGGTGGPSFVGHPGDPVVGLSASSSGNSQGAQSELPKIVTVQGVDRDGGPVEGSGAADEVFDLRSNGHVSRIDDSPEGVKR